MYSNELVCCILDFLDDNLNRKISIEEIACKFYYNRYYIMKLFKKELGVTTLTYMNRMRIIHSIRDIQLFNYSLTKVAIRNGFYSLEYFSEVFHKIMGVSPSVYQTYCNCRFRLSSQELESIGENWANLSSFVNFIEAYKKNKKPRSIPVLKRSIFH